MGCTLNSRAAAHMAQDATVSSMFTSRITSARCCAADAMLPQCRKSDMIGRLQSTTNSTSYVMNAVL